MRVFSPVLILLICAFGAIIFADGGVKKGDIIWKNSLTWNTLWLEGNSRYLETGFGVVLNRNNMWVDEWTFNLNGSYRFQTDSNWSAVDSRLSAILRYGWSITEKLYHFTRLGARTDGAQGLLYELYPATGVGYWFSDTESLKFMSEAGGGYIYSDYSGSISSSVSLYLRLKLDAFFQTNLSMGFDLRVNPNLERLLGQFSAYIQVKAGSFFLKPYIKVLYDSAPLAGVLAWDLELGQALGAQF